MPNFGSPNHPGSPRAILRSHPARTLTTLERRRFFLGRLSGTSGPTTPASHRRSAPSSQCQTAVCFPLQLRTAGFVRQFAPNHDPQSPMVYPKGGIYGRWRPHRSVAASASKKPAASPNCGQLRVRELENCLALLLELFHGLENVGRMHHCRSATHENGNPQRIHDFCFRSPGF